MPNPPQFTIVTRSYPDGKIRYLVKNGNAWLRDDSGHHHFARFSTDPIWKTLSKEKAEAECRRLWENWLGSLPHVIEYEEPFDPA